MKQEWIVSEKKKKECVSLTEELGVSPLVAQLLINRGLNDPKAARSFLNVSLESIHDPFLLCDMEKAVEHILNVIDQKLPITIYGDYDVDGMTSTTLLLEVLETLGAQADYYIPHRLDEGYGVHTEALKVIAQRGTKLIITVDCGISAQKEVKAAQEMGMGMIITDHHEPGTHLPEGIAVINPKRHDDAYPFKGLAGVGVAYKLAQALLARVYKQTDYPYLGIQWLDLVALGTVADIVPLVEENRILVKEGLKILNQDKRLGIKVLREKAGWGKKELTEETVGFYLSPRLNSAGRIDTAQWGIKLLKTQDLEEAEAIGNELNRLNTERQAICSSIYQEALLLMDEQVDLENEKVIVLAGAGWHHGTIGIVASRLLEHFYRPVILLCDEGQICRGSARSIVGFHLFKALESCGDVLQSYGGHEQAAGLSLLNSNVKDFRRMINRLADHWLTEADLIRRLEIDASVHLKQITLNLVEEIKSLAPFGNGNPVPTFIARDIVLDKAIPVGGGKHLKIVADHIDGIGFGLGEYLGEIQQAEQIDLAFNLGINEWNGSTKPQMQLVDYRDQSVGFPTREFLASLYCLLKQCYQQDNRGLLSNDQLVKRLGKAGAVVVDKTMVSHAVKIFIELGIVFEETSGRGKAIRLNPEHKKKINLTDSPYYVKGLKE